MTGERVACRAIEPGGRILSGADAVFSCIRVRKAETEDSLVSP